MKKLLALVLALVMSMSLVTISNAAFKDADKIDYKEAVDVMNAVGVFIGDEKGNFNAKENLTREQAAKIIAYLELGSKAADALVGGATFTDVASTRWAALPSPTWLPPAGPPASSATARRLVSSPASATASSILPVS
mgnify:CR=1 FL=1